MSENYIIKLLTLGYTTVGKTSITLRYSENKFRNTFFSTIGVDSKSKSIKIGKDTVKVTIRDTAGQEKYQSIAKTYYLGVNGALLIYDITNEFSFQKVDFWYNDLKNNANIDEMFLCLVGNKMDLKQNRVVARETAEKYAKEKNIPYYEVSAKSGEGIKLLFDDIINKIVKKIKLNLSLDKDIEERGRTSLLNNEDYEDITEKKQRCRCRRCC